MTKIKALLFDFDGLILDTEYPLFQVWQDEFLTYGQNLEIETWAIGLGTSHTGNEIFNDLDKHFKFEINRADFIKKCEKRAIKKIINQPIQPGVEQYIKVAKNLGLKLGVASSSERTWVIGHLKRLGIIANFDCVFCQEDVKKVKPDPELFNRVLEYFRITPDQAVVFEDSPNGISAAISAGIMCVAVQNSVSRHLKITHADIVLESLEQIPLEQLLEKIEAMINQKKY